MGNAAIIYGVLKLILNPTVIGWLRVESKKSEVPIDDWAVELLDKLLEGQVVNKKEEK